MGTQLDRDAYQKLIDENIQALETYMPEHSLEKKHIIEVLKWSVDQIYGKKEKKCKECNGDGKILHDYEHGETSICNWCNGTGKTE